MVHHAAIRTWRGKRRAVERYRTDPDTDFQLQLASEITGLPRKDAKDVNFAKINGAGVKRFAEMIGKPLAEAQAIYTLYDRWLPFISRLDDVANARLTGGLSPCSTTAPADTGIGGRRESQQGAGPCPLEEAQQRTRDPEHPWYDEPARVGHPHRAQRVDPGRGCATYQAVDAACSREGVVPFYRCTTDSNAQSRRASRVS